MQTTWPPPLAMSVVSPSSKTMINKPPAEKFGLVSSGGMFWLSQASALANSWAWVQLGFDAGQLCALSIAFGPIHKKFGNEPLLKSVANWVYGTRFAVSVALLRTS